MKNSALKNGTVVKYYSRAGELVGTGVICGSGEKSRQKEKGAEAPFSISRFGSRW